MNIRRGLFRLWLVAAFLWVAGVCVFAVPAIINTLHYQFVPTLREGQPWTQDWNWDRPFYETHKPPMEALPIRFVQIDSPNLAKFRERVVGGSEIRVQFADASALYLPTSLTELDKQLLSQLFWSERWWRWWGASWVWILGAVLPPLSFLVLGSALLWAFGGFEGSTRV